MEVDDETNIIRVCGRLAGRLNEVVSNYANFNVEVDQGRYQCHVISRTQKSELLVRVVGPCRVVRDGSDISIEGYIHLDIVPSHALQQFCIRILRGYHLHITQDLIGLYTA